MKNKKRRKIIYFCKKYFSKDVMEQIARDLKKLTTKDKESK